MIFLLYYLSCGAVLAQEVDAVPEIDPFAGINEETDWNVFDQSNDPIEVDEESFGHDYTKALKLCYKFFYAQMSGKLPEDHPLDWRGDSALNDGKDNGVDLSGGYYDGGGFIKYGFPMAFSTTMMAWSTIHYWRTLKDVGETKAALETLRWGADYLMKCHPEDGVFYIQVSDKTNDENFWGRIEDGEKLNYQRKSYKVDVNHKGTEPVAEAAAALAATSIVFAEIDAYYADDCRRHAIELFEMAWKPDQRRKYDQTFKEAGKAYKSFKGFYDELAWAAIWLYKATGKQRYLINAVGVYKNQHLEKDISSFSWENKTPAVHYLMAEISKQAQAARYKNTFRLFCRDKGYGGKAKRTPLGLLYLNDWGPLRHAAAAAGLCFMAAQMKIDPDANFVLGQSQLDYILGDNGRSYVVGYGNDFPTRYYHKESFCPEQPEPCGSFTGIPNRHQLDGALVGGPDEFDRYDDDPWKQQQSSVAMDYNAMFLFSLLGKIDHETYGAKPPPRIPPGRGLKVGDMSQSGARSQADPEGYDPDRPDSGNRIDYFHALQKTLLFYHAQRAGEIPEDFPIGWRKNATMQDIDGDETDLTGGYFDGGGTMKYTFPMAYSITMLAWSVIEYPDSYGEHIEEVKDIIKHGADWLHNAARSTKIVASIGNQTYENEFWGRAEDMKAKRPIYSVTDNQEGTDLAAQIVCALAATSIIFADDTEYSQKLISKAESVMQFAENNEGFFAEHVPEAGMYQTSNFKDELAWANIWMYQALKNEDSATTYLETARNIADSEETLQSNPKIFDVDTKVAAVQLMLALEEDEETTTHLDEIKGFCDFYSEDVQKTVYGLAFPSKYAATGYASSASFLCFLAAEKLSGKIEPGIRTSWKTFGFKQMDYLLGSSGRSYLVGYGDSYPFQAFHRGASCPNRPLQCTAEGYKDRDAPNMQILNGALVSGPDEDGHFSDKRLATKYTAVNLDRNACFTAALSAAEFAKNKKDDDADSSSMAPIINTISILILTILLYI